LQRGLPATRYQDPHYWTSVITFAANWGRKPA
jgi:hypothetical protein